MEGEPWVTTVRSCGIGVLIAFISLLFFLFFAALGVWNGSIPQENRLGAILVSTFLSTLLGAVYTLSQGKKQGILLGILVGFFLFLLLFVLGLCFFSGDSTKDDGVTIFLAALCGGAVGKLFVKKKKKNSKKS